MAGMFENSMFIPNNNNDFRLQNDLFPTITPIQPDTDSFSDVLAELNKVNDKPKVDTHPTAHLTNDPVVKEHLKKTMDDVFHGRYEDIQNRSKELLETTREELKRAIAKLKELAEKELRGEKGDIRLQAYINGLFQEVQGTEEQSAEEITLEIMLKRIQELQKIDADTSAIMAELVPLLTQLQSKSEAQAENPNDLTVPVVDGSISFKSDENTKYTMGLNQFYDALVKTEAALNGEFKIEVPVDPDAVDTEMGVIPDGENTNSEIPEPTVPDGTIVEEGTAAPKEEITAPEVTNPEIDGEASIIEGEATEEVTSPEATEEIVSENNSEDDSSDLNSMRINDTSDEVAEVLANLSAQRNTQVNEVTENIVAKPVAIQIADSVASSLRHPKIGTSELTMTLNPSNLGQLQIKIINEAGRLSVIIAAQSEITQKILEDRVSSLITSLQNINSNISEVKVVKPDEAAFANLNLNDFSSNQQANQSNSGRKAYIQYAEEVTYANEVEETNKNSNEPYRRGNKLWQTV